MDFHLDKKIREKMQRYMDTFIHSLQGDNNARRSFASTLSAFQGTVRTHRDKLQTETLIAVQGFATIIDTVASGVLELEMESEKLRRDTMADISRILNEKMGKLTIGDEPYHVSSKNVSNSHSPSYIRPSYDWFLSNLHNPYPSKEVKKDLARRYKCSVKDIDAWFIDARKRIGWNTLRRQKFSNKQEHIIAAASRFFKPSAVTFTDDPSATLESEGDFNDAYHAEFTALEDAARSLYSGRFVDLSHLNRPLKMVPSIPLSKSAVKGDERRNRPFFSQPANSGTELDTETLSPLSSIDTIPILSYPTPEPSPGRFAVESPPFTSVPLSLPNELLTQSRKRRRTSVEPSREGEHGVGDPLIRPRKRFRLDARESPHTTETVFSILSSPAPTINLSESLSEGDTAPAEPPSSAPTAPANFSSKRKRRLSEGDSRRPAKRPHHALAVPRLQAVSDPFPNPRPFTDDSINEWFFSNFSAERQLTIAIPSPASLDVHDLPVGIPLEVQCDLSAHQIAVPLPKLSFLGHDKVSPEVLCSSIPDEVSKSSTPENLLTSNSLPDFNEVQAVEVASADELFLSLDFGLPFTVEGTNSRDMPFNPPVDQMRNFDPLLQLPPLDFDWVQFPLAGSVNTAEFPTSFMTENPSIFDFDSIIHKGTAIPEDQDVKRLRLQFLREELQLLESEIGP
ncbi:C-terminal domain of homeodomain 1-domain-containing protein [Gymnopilus junonius]|uniref:C-terminal domain of homeodomain 1-domain-containing protein n=1 Tax=Gymnopilus junonius TaxID=109634 RepID=A0A9P5TVC2_GYMJU|nr:C-terminal domain of homeodomain 1-domain-containing protein [Gymnopilus junonius]